SADSASATPAATVSAAPQSNGRRPAAGRTKASPLARRLAREHGIDLESLTGSGPRGRIVKNDVLAAVADGNAGAAPSSAAPASTTAVSGATAPGGSRGAVETVPATRIQRAVAQRMTEAKASIPHFQLAVEID